MKFWIILQGDDLKDQLKFWLKGRELWNGRWKKEAADNSLVASYIRG